MKRLGVLQVQHIVDRLFLLNRKQIESTLRQFTDSEAPVLLALWSVTEPNVVDNKKLPNTVGQK